MAGWPILGKMFGLSVAGGLVALSVPYLMQRFPAGGLANLPSLFPDVASWLAHSDATTTLAGQPFACLPQTYTTSVVSLDPLVIYISGFLSPADIAALLAVGDPLFQPSFVTKHGRTVGTPDRTSWSAGLSRDEPVVRCVLSRAAAFMGTLLAPGRDEMGPPQLVRYTAGQRFNIHHDWYREFQPADDGRDAEWNRVASFFAILQDNCTKGETYFPYISAVAPQDRTGAAGVGGVGGSPSLWREHKDGGLAFRPVAGNALFWMNLHPNGTGDRRVRHAGLPVGEGLKTAMNIWPRQYRGPEAWDWSSPPV